MESDSSIAARSSFTPEFCSREVTEVSLEITDSSLLDSTTCMLISPVVCKIVWRMSEMVFIRWMLYINSLERSVGERFMLYRFFLFMLSRMFFVKLMDFIILLNRITE